MKDRQQSGSYGDRQTGPKSLPNKAAQSNTKATVRGTQSTPAARPLKSGNKG